MDLRHSVGAVVVVSLWAERCTSSSFAQQAVNYGITTAPELLSLANGWREWARDPDAVFVVLHGEVLARS